MLIPLCLFGGLIASLEICFLIGRRSRARRKEDADQHSNIQAATLGLLALLLGFSFALAAGRFSDRVDLIVREANAISTAWLRCDLLGEAQCQEVRGLLQRYTDLHISAYETREEAVWTADMHQSEILQTEIWSIVVREAKAAPEFAHVLLPDFNAMFDLHDSRVAATHRHMPGMLLTLLITCSLASVAAVGFGCGVSGKRNVLLTTTLSFLIAGTLWAIIDMDYPRKGLIRVGQQPMLDLQRSLERTAPKRP